MGVGEVVCDSVVVRLHGLLAGLPSGRADFSVLVGELEGLHKTQSFVDVAANREIVDGDLKRKRHFAESCFENGNVIMRFNDAKILVKYPSAKTWLRKFQKMYTSEKELSCSKMFQDKRIGKMASSRKMQLLLDSLIT